MSDASSKETQFKSLQDAFSQQLPERIADVLSAWSQARTRPDSKDARTVLARRIHGLSGSAGTFGFGRIGSIAQEAELLARRLDGSPPMSASVLEEIGSLLQALSDLVGEGPQRTRSTLRRRPNRPLRPRNPTLIHILEDDSLLAEHIATQLSHYGYKAEVFDGSENIEALIAEKPAARIVDIVLPEGDLEGPRITAEMKSRTGQDVPTIFISVRSDWPARLSAVRANGCAYLAKPIEIMDLVQELDNITGRTSEEPLRILIIDDDQTLARHHSDVLRARGMQTSWSTTPSSLLDLLAEFRPDLVLMDLYMPQCTGIECARVVRQHAIYDNLPIVYLSSESVMDRQLDALIVGADGFLQKPIQDEHLALAVDIRAKRFRRLNALMSQDGLTGLLNHVTFKQALAREVSASVRRSSPLSLAMIDLDDFKTVNDTRGHLVGDIVLKSLARLLKERGRQSDIMGRYGGEEFAVALPDTSPEDALGFMEEIRISFSEIHHTSSSGFFNTTFSAGIASTPPHEDPLTLLHAADEALYAAKARGRNCVEMQASGDDAIH